MKAFSFLNGSKKSQQQPLRRQQPAHTQLSVNIAELSQDYDPAYSDQSSAPRSTGLQSPAYSTISFFSSWSAPSRTGSGANTPEPTHSTHPIGSGSGRSNAGHGKSRPSLTLLRPRISNDGNHLSAEKPGVGGGGSGGGLLNIYSRFGFSRSSSQLPQDQPPTPTYPTPPPLPGIPVVSIAPALPSTAPVTPNRQYQLLHQQMFPETTVESPQQIPSVQQIEREPSPIATQPPKVGRSVDGHEIAALHNPASTSLILQRRRAKSLGNTNSGSTSHRTPTALKIPAPSAEPAPPLPPSRAESVKSSSIPRPVNAYLPPANAHTTALPPTPMSSASSLTSELASQAPSRVRSESGSTRLRSESSSSRARSESTSSSASSSRHGHGYSSSYKSRSAKATAMGRLDDFWDEFLKEIDEDMSDLCVDTAPIQSAAATPTRPIRIEEHDRFLCARGTNQADPPVLRPRASSSPRRKGTKPILEPLKLDSSKLIAQTITVDPKSNLRTVRSLHSPPLTAPLVTAAKFPDPKRRTDGSPPGPLTKSVPHDSPSLLPYLGSSSSFFQRSPDSSKGQLAHIPPQSPPTFVRSLSHANLRSFDSRSSSQPPTPQPSTPQPTPVQHFSREPTSPGPDPEDSRPCSTHSQCSQASQFSLSLFPSPPSVPLIRTTTDNGTFGTVASPSSDKDHWQAEERTMGTPTLRFKPIVPSTRAKPHVRAVLFERDENGHPVLSMPLATPRFAIT